MLLALIRIEHDEHRTAFVSLIIAQNIQQFIARRINVHTRKFIQILPRKYNIVSVHDQILLLRTARRVDRIALLIVLDHVRLGLICLLFHPLAPLLILDILAAHSELSCVNLLQLLIKLPACLTFRLIRLLHTYIRATRTESLIRSIIEKAILRLLPVMLINIIQMHIIRHLIPWYNKSCAVRTEHGTGWVRRIRLAVITDPRHHFLTVVADIVSVKIECQMPQSLRISVDARIVIPHRCNRCRTMQNRRIRSRNKLRRIKLAKSLPEIRHCPSHRILRHFKRKRIYRFEKYALRRL